MGQIQYYAQEMENAGINNMDIAMNEYQAYYLYTDGKIKINRLFTDDQITNFNIIKGEYEKAQLTRNKDLDNAY